MRKVFLLLGAFAACSAGAADAAQLPFAGTLHVQVGVLAFDLDGTGVAEVDSLVNPTRFSIAGGTFSTRGLVSPVPPTFAALNYPVVALQATVENGPGSFSLVPRHGHLAYRGTMPLFGIAKVCLYATCPDSPLANVSVPFDAVGVGGVVTVRGPVNATVIGAPWTTDTYVSGLVASGMVTSATFFTRGFRRGPDGLTGSTFEPGGEIKLVTPVYVRTSLPVFIPAHAALTLHFVPEPDALVLIGMGLVGLRLASRSRTI